MFEPTQRSSLISSAGKATNESLVSNSRMGSRVRKRPVSFGNPALGTYHGFVYTLQNDEVGSGNSADATRINNAGPNARSATNRAGSNMHEWPLVEGAIAVRRLVAMVDVRPEQVPEGILNLARSHRPWIDHVRIVIGEHGSTPYPEVPQKVQRGEGNGKTVKTASTSKTSQKQQFVRFNSFASDASPIESNDSTPPPSALSIPLSPNASAAENAASILAREQLERESSLNRTDDEYDSDYDDDVDHEDETGDREDGNAENNKDRNQNSSSTQQFDNFDASQVRPDRTYVALVEMCSEEAADQFVSDLHWQPYTILDETDVCNVYHVIAIQGEDGVSLMSPFFASKTPAATAADIDPSTSGSASDIEIAASSSSSSSPTAFTAGNQTLLAAATDDNVESMPHSMSAQSVDDHYNCAVCLERIDVDHRSMSIGSSDDMSNMHLADMEFPSSRSTSILTTVCNHSFHLDCLLQWQDSPCPVCRYDHSGLNEALSQCHVCDTTDNNYVCLICGVVSCGDSTIGSYEAPAAAAASGPDYIDNNNSESNQCSMSENSDLASSRRARRMATSHSHARQHYDETLHAYALSTETQHVWDFAGQGYVHRLLQNKEDGKLVEVNDPNNTTSQERTLSPGLSNTQEGEAVHRKLEGYATQYYTLLKSQLEQQRIFYEGRLEEIRREYAVKDDNPRGKGTARSGASMSSRKKGSDDLIAALKQERTQLRHRLQSLKSRFEKVQDDVAFLINMNESLEAYRVPLKMQLEQVKNDRVDQRNMFEQCIIPPLQEKVTKLMLQLETGTTSEDNGNYGDDRKLPPTRRR